MFYQGVIEDSITPWVYVLDNAHLSFTLMHPLVWLISCKNCMSNKIWLLMKREKIISIRISDSFWYAALVCFSLPISYNATQLFYIP